MPDDDGDKFIEEAEEEADERLKKLRTSRPKFQEVRRKSQRATSRGCPYEDDLYDGLSDITEWQHSKSVIRHFQKRFLAVTLLSDDIEWLTRRGR